MKNSFWGTWTTKLGFLFFVYGFLYIFISYSTFHTLMPEFLIPSAVWISLGCLLGAYGIFSKKAIHGGLWSKRNTAWRAGLIFLIVAMYFPIVNLPHIDTSNLSFSLTANVLGSLVYFIIGVIFMLIDWYLNSSPEKPEFWKSWQFKLGTISIVYSYIFFLSLNRNSGAILSGFLVYSLIYAVIGVVLITLSFFINRGEGQLGIWRLRKWNWRLGLCLILSILLYSLFDNILGSDSVKYNIFLTSYFVIIGAVFMVAGGINLNKLPHEKLGLWQNRNWLWRCALLTLVYSFLSILIELFVYIVTKGFSLPSLYIFIAFASAVLMFLARDKGRTELPPDKMGFWENRPQLWKVGIVFIIWDCTRIIDALNNGTLAERFSSIESIIKSLILSATGIILMLLSAVKSRKLY